MRVRLGPMTGGRLLLRQSGLSGVAQFLPQLVGLVTIPYILGRLGFAAYGVWTLVQSVVVVLVSLDGGISGSAQRFYALYAADGRRDLAPRLTATVGMAALGGGALLWLLGPWLAQALVALTNVPANLVDDAIFLFSRVGVLVAALLLANVVMGQLRADGSFGRVLVATVLSQAAMVGALVHLGDALDLRSMFSVLLAQTGVLLLALLAADAAELRQLRFALATRAQLHEFWQFASRSLVMNASSLAILQAGPVVVSMVASIEQVGYLGIAGQLASAVRSLPLFVMAPALTAVTAAFGSGGRAAAAPLANRLNRVWFPLVTGYSLVAAAAMWFVVRGFAGDAPVAGYAAVLLTIGHGLNVATGVASVYCRSVGRPGIEARYGIALCIGVLAATPVGAWLGGAVGAAAATMLAQAVAAAYLAMVLRRDLPELELPLRGALTWRWVAAAVLAAGVALLSLALPPHHVTTLAVAAAGAAVGVAVGAVLDPRARAIVRRGTTEQKSEG